MTTRLPDDLTADWPSEPENEALVQFAAELRASLPEMGAAAQEKIHAALVREMACAPASPRGWAKWARAAMAAGIVVAVGVGSVFLWPRPGLDVPPAQVADLPPKPPVVDRYAVKVNPASVAGDKALLPIDDNQSLFMD